MACFITTDTNNQDLIDPKDVDQSCNSKSVTPLDTVYTAACYGQKYCEFDTTAALFQSTTTCTEKMKTRYVYISAKCLGKFFPFTGLKGTVEDVYVSDSTSISRSTVAYLVVMVDAVIIVAYLLMAYILKYSQRAATKNILQNAYSASAYTLNIRNLPENMSGEELTAELWKFLEERASKGARSECKVVDIQLVFPTRAVYLQSNLGEIIKQVLRLTLNLNYRKII